jgi:PAS domain-containing protein
MTESPDRHDDSWYQDQWEDLMDLFSVSEPQAVVSRMQTLQTALSNSNFSRFEDVLQAMKSMEAQLDDLYTEKASTAQVTAGDDEHNQDTYEQLQSLVAREDKLRRALGVSSADAVVEMVEGLTDQLDVLYAERDAEASPPPNSFLGDSNSQSERAQIDPEISDPDAVLAMVRSLSEQLDALYADREQLAEHGINDLDHALSLIDSMEEQLVDLYAERRRHTVDDPLLPPDTLRRLDGMDDDALNAVPAGAICVDDDGVIQRANTAALQWPGFSAERVDSLAGRPFGDHAAPGSDNVLFRRSPEGHAPTDTRFLYTYAGADTTTTLLVQLYSPHAASGYWILFRPT